MKRTLIILIAFVVLFSHATPTSAQTITSRGALLQELQSLLIQLAELQEQLQSMQRARVAGVRTSQLTPSEYYRGDYEAIYLVKNTTLLPYKNTISSQTDSDLWNVFVDIVGKDVVRSYITEFRVYNDEHAEYDAFVEQIGSSDDWIFGVNVAHNSLSSRLDREAVRELFIHEYAHILYFYNERAQEDFVETFWEKRSRDQRDYVSEYAMIDEEEDFAESFTHFVLYPQPTGNLIRNEKVLFFYEYATFRDIRAGIRNRSF